MSTRVLIELNMDVIDRVVDDPEVFTVCLVNLLQHASGDRKQQLESTLRTRFGVTVKHTRHHSDPDPTE